MLSTCRGWPRVEEGSSHKFPLSLLKLTSRTILLLEKTSSSGRSPYNKLWDRLRCSRSVRLPRDTEMCPSRLLQAKKTSVTVFSELQVIPSQLQQSMVFSHKLLKPPSWDSSETKWSKELLSFSVHEVARGTKERRITRAVPSSGMGNLLVVVLQEEWHMGFMSSLMTLSALILKATCGPNTCPMYALRPVYAGSIKSCVSVRDGYI